MRHRTDLPAVPEVCSGQKSLHLQTVFQKVKHLASQGESTNAGGRLWGKSTTFAVHSSIIYGDTGKASHRIWAIRQLMRPLFLIF